MCVGFLNELHLAPGWQMTLKTLHCGNLDYSDVFKHFEGSRDVLFFLIPPAPNTMLDTLNSLDTC